MADNAIKIVIKADSNEAKTNIDQLAAQFKKLYETLKQPLGNIESFAALKKALGENQQAFKEAQARVKELAKEFKATDSPSKELAANFEKAKKEAGNLKDAIAKQAAELHNLKQKMSAAGVDVTKLASEHLRLKTALAQATEELKKQKAVALARDDLGLKSTQQTRAEIERLKASYSTLRASGTMTMKELAEAKLRVNQRIQELKASNNGLIEAFDRAKVAIVGLVGAAMGIKTAVTASKDLETAMSDVAKVVDAPAEKIEQLRLRFLELSRTIPRSAIELARIAEAAGQMGIASNDIEQFVIIVAKMAEAFKMTAEDAGTASGKLMNLYQLNLPGLAQLADAVNVLGNNTNAVERDILNVITRTGGAAQIFRLTAEQTAALATAFLSLGRTPETASMAISALLSKLQTAPAQGKEFQEALDKIGISAQQLADEIEKDPQAALLKFLDTLKQLGRQDLSQTLVKLFGLEYQDDISILVTGLDKYKEALGFVADATKTAGAVDQEYRRGLQTLDSQLKLAGNAFTELWTALGDTVLPISKSIVQGVTAIVQTISDLVRVEPGLADLVLVLGTLAASFGALKVIALAVNLFFGSFITTLGQVKAAFALAFTGLTAFQTALVGLGGILVTAIAVDRIVELTKVFKSFLDLQKDISKMSDSYRKAADEFKDFKEVKVKGLNELKLLEEDQLQAEYEGLQKAMSYWNRYRAALETLAQKRDWGGLFQTDEAKAAEAELPKVNARIEELREAMVNASKAAKANGTALKDFRERAREAAETAEQTGKAFDRDMRVPFDKAKESIKDLAQEHQRSSKAISDSYDLMAERARAGVSDEQSANQAVLEIYRQKKDALVKHAEETAAKQKEVLNGSRANEQEYANEAKGIAEQLRDAKIKALEGYQEKLKSSLSEALADEKKYAEEVKKLQKELRDARMSTEETIRELQRKTMTESQAWADKQKQASETLRKAFDQVANAKTPEALKEAQALAEKAKQEYAGLAGEVKEGDKVVVSMAQSVKTAIDGVTEAQKAIEAAITKQVELAEQNRQSAEKQAADFRTQWEENKKLLDELANMKIEPTATIKVDSAAIDAKLAEIQRDTHSTHYIHVVKVEGGGGGGGEPDSDSDEGDGYRWGGLVAAMSRGGNWLRMLGKLPGWGGGDRIRALLEAGEFVVRKEAVAKYGAGLFEGLNNLRINLPSIVNSIAMPPEIPRAAYATGGPVGASESYGLLRLQAGDKELPVLVPGTNGRLMVKEFEKELHKLRLTRKR